MIKFEWANYKTFLKRDTLRTGPYKYSLWVVISTKPVTYKLKDYQDQPHAGGFYQEELLKVKYPDIYLIEIFKKRDKKVYVKWLGFDSSHDSWVEKSDM